MFPKKGEIWSYRDRGRAFGLAAAVLGVGFIFFGIYLIVTGRGWLMVLLGVLNCAFAALFLWENERQHRDEQ